MSNVLVPGYVRWTGTAYTTDPGIEIVGPPGTAGADGPPGPVGNAGLPGVDNIAALKALVVIGEHMVVSVSGYYTPGDGGGGEFYWDSISQTTDNGGTIIASNAGGLGRWKRIINKQINVKWFGAYGDGSLNDRTPIQAAINVCSNNGGGVVYFPTGTYALYTGLDPIVVKGVNLIGDGSGATVIVPHPGISAIRFGDDAADYINIGGVSGFTFAFADPTNSVCIDIRNAAGINVDDIELQNATTFMRIGTLDKVAGSLSVRRLRGYLYYNPAGMNLGYPVFDIINGGGLWITDVNVIVGSGGVNSPTNTSPVGPATGSGPGQVPALGSYPGHLNDPLYPNGITFFQAVLRPHSPTDSAWDTTYLSNVSTQLFSCGIYAYSGGSGNFNFLEVDTCIFDNCGDTGMSISMNSDGSASPGPITVSNSTFTGWDGYGIKIVEQLIGHGFLESVTINGCYVHDTGHEGIVLGTQIRNLSLSGTVVIGAGRNGGIPAISVLGGAAYAKAFTITGCVAGADSSGNAFSTYGLSIGQDCDNYTISGNHFMGTIAPASITATTVASIQRAFISSQNLINVADFGAKGDGIANDTAAIQSALNLSKINGMAVYMPAGIYKITSSLKFETASNTVQGINLYGDGRQQTIIDNRSGAAAIVIDGAMTGGSYTFQRGLSIKNLAIDCLGSPSQTTRGIDIRAAYHGELNNLRIENQGGHAIRVINAYFNAGSSDGDANAWLKIKRCWIVGNGILSSPKGWGVYVDTDGYAGVSTGFMIIEDSHIERNRGGGISWTGQLFKVDNCGIYGNGVVPGIQDGNPANYPAPVSGAYGIQIRNPGGVVHGAKIEGCEIQGNAATQVIVEDGKNVEIRRCEFSADDLDVRFSFPSRDILVGDGYGVAAQGTIIRGNRVRAVWSTITGSGWGQNASQMPAHSVVKINSNAVDTEISKWWKQTFTEDSTHILVELVSGHSGTKIERGDNGGMALSGSAYVQVDMLAIDTESRFIIPDQYIAYRYRFGPGTPTSTLILNSIDPILIAPNARVILYFANGTNSVKTIKFSATSFRTGFGGSPPQFLLNANIERVIEFSYDPGSAQWFKLSDSGEL